MPKKQVRIPTLVALCALTIIAVSGWLISTNSTTFFGKAQIPAFAPTNVQISNITDTSFTVSWKTNEAVPGYVRYKTAANTYEKAFDVRDTDRLAKSYQLHYVTIANLTPSQQIVYDIVNADKPYNQEAVTTGTTIPTAIQALPVYGTLKTIDGGNTKGAMVSALLDGAALWTTLVSNTTSWVIPLTSIRTSDLTSWYCTDKSCADNTAITLTIDGQEGATSMQTTIGEARPIAEEILIGIKQTAPTASNTASPVPTVIPTINTSPSPEVKGVSTVISTPTPTIAPTAKPKPTTTPTPTDKPKKREITILNPVENAMLSFAQPLIRGTGIPNEEVAITIRSTITQVGKTTVREDGTWLWTPTIALTSGKYTLTVKTKDQQKRAITITRLFTILKSGEQVLAGATAAATLVPTRIPTVVQPTTPVYPTNIPTPTTAMPKTGTWETSLFLIGGGATLLLLGLTIL